MARDAFSGVPTARRRGGRACLGVLSVLLVLSVAQAVDAAVCPTTCAVNNYMMDEVLGQGFARIDFSSAPTLDTCIKAVSLVGYKYYWYNSASRLCNGYTFCEAVFFDDSSSGPTAYVGLVAACPQYSACSTGLSIFPRSCPTNMEWKNANKYCCCKTGFPVPLLNHKKTYGCRALSYTTGVFGG